MSPIKGFLTDVAPDHAGLDVGVADLIHEGKVVVKSGVEISQFTPHSVIYSDGSEQEADVIIFASVYTFNRTSLRAFGIYTPL